MTNKPKCICKGDCRENRVKRPGYDHLEGCPCHQAPERTVARCPNCYEIKRLDPNIGHCFDCISLSENKVKTTAPEEQLENEKLEIFMDFCDLFRDYFKKAEIEMFDHTIGHLAVIARDYVISSRQNFISKREMEKWVKNNLGDGHAEFCKKKGKQFKKCGACLYEEFVKLLETK